MDATSSLLASQIGAGAASAYIINLLQAWKRTPWISAHTAGVNIVLRSGLTLAATLGISWQWSAAPVADTHILAIMIPSGTVLLHGLWHWFNQYAIAHWVGSSLQKPAELAQVPPKPSLAQALEVPLAPTPANFTKE